MPRLGAKIFTRLKYGLVILLILLGLPVASAGKQDQVAEHYAYIIKAKKRLPIQGVGAQLQNKKVIYIGEHHDRYDHHLNQLEVIKAVYRTNKNLAIGVEFFQTPYQDILDQYIKGKLAEADMLKATEYYQRWGHDYRLYRPIMRYARDNKIPVIALNMSSELAKKISAQGLAGLIPEERSVLPVAITPPNARYKQLMHDSYAMHTHKTSANFERFVEMQVMWDEFMAQQAVNYLDANPDKQMIILAGDGHVIYGDGLPTRINGRLNVDQAIVMTDDHDNEFDEDAADIVLTPYHAGLPAIGRLGISFDPRHERIVIDEFSASSLADDAGLKVGDILTAINGVEIQRFSDLQIHMLDTRPGDVLALSIVRQEGDNQQTLVFKVKLLSSKDD